MVIARELKKKLVEQNKLEVNQQEVEKNLFNLIVSKFFFLLKENNYKREAIITLKITLIGIKWFRSIFFYFNKN